MSCYVLAAALFAISGPVLAGNVGLSVTIGQPGFYGQIDIGNAPQPQLIYTQPVVVQPAPEFRSAPPIYLHVPAGYERHWRAHCAEYHACGRRVYFVRHDWYQNVYAPHYRHEHEWDRGHEYREDRDHRDDHRYDHRDDRDHREDRDHGEHFDHDAHAQR